MGRIVKSVAKLVVIGAATAIGTLVGGPLGGRIGLLAGSMLSGSVLNDKKKAPAPTPTQLSRLQARLDTQAPRKMVLGSTAFPVDIRYYEGSGANEEYVDYILVLAAHRMGALNEVWFDDQLAWTVSGGMQAPYAAYTAAFAVVYEGNAGNTQAINGGARWGSDDRLTGCAYVHIRVKRTGNSDSDQSPYANGLPTRITAIGVGMPMYDPRFDSTRGGSGSMRVDDQNTWGPSSGNTVIQSLNALLGWRINGKLSVGAGIPPKYINFDSVITAANACEEDIVLAGGGTQPRYRTAGAFSTDDAPMNIVGALLAGCAGDLLDSDGQLSFLIKTNTLAIPAVTFDDHDILSPGRWDPMGGQTNLPNIISGNFTDPSSRSLYQPVPYPSVRIDSEDGIERTAPVDLAVVENAPQAERLVKQTLQRMQYPGLFSAEYNMKGMAAKVGRIVWQSYSPRGWVNKPFRVVSQKPSRSGRIALVLREEHEDIYAWEAEDSAAVEPAEPVRFDPTNTGPHLLARKAAQTASWSKVQDDDGNRPEDNAQVTDNAGLHRVDNQASQKLGTIAPGADVTGQNTAADTAAVAGRAAAELLDDADVARADAAIALTALGNIANDSKFTAGEKIQVRTLRDGIVTEFPVWRDRAVAFGVAAQLRSDYQAAYNNLTAYLSSVFIDSNNTTSIARGTFNARFTAYFGARERLVDAITSQAGERSTWAGVSGAGKPADNATRNTGALADLNTVGAANMTEQSRLSLIPDGSFSDVNWWNGKASDGLARANVGFGSPAANDGNWRHAPRYLIHGPGTFDHSTPLFDIPLGARLRIQATIFTSPDFNGWINHVIHMPDFAWWAIGYNGSVAAPENHRWVTSPSSGWFTAHDVICPVTVPAAKRWQFRFLGQINAGHATFQCRIAPHFALSDKPASMLDKIGWDGRIENPEFLNTQLLVGPRGRTAVQPFYDNQSWGVTVHAPSHAITVATSNGPRIINYGSSSVGVPHNTPFYGFYDDVSLSGGNPALQYTTDVNQLFWRGRYEVMNGRTPLAPSSGGGGGGFGPGGGGGSYTPGGPIPVPDV